MASTCACKGVGLDAGGLGEGFERIVLLDDLAFEHFFKEARALLLSGLYVGFVADGEALLAFCLFRTMMASARTLRLASSLTKRLPSALTQRPYSAAAVWLNCQPMSDPAFFTRATPRATLDPVVLDLECADCARFTPHFGRGARLVGRIERAIELRILEHTELHVSREATVAEDHALRRADRFTLPESAFGETIAFADLYALDAVVTADDVFDENAVAKRNAKFFALIKFLRHDARTRAVRRRNVARNVVTAFLTDSVGKDTERLIPSRSIHSWRGRARQDNEPFRSSSCSCRPSRMSFSSKSTESSIL